MSFERTSGCIKNLSGRDKITLDAMLDMLVCVSQDVLAHNKELDVRSLPVSNQSLLLKMEYNLMQMLVLIDKENRSGLSEFGKGVQERYQNYAAEIKQTEEALTDVIKEIEIVEAKEEELKKVHDKLMEEREHFLESEEECKRFENEIEEMKQQIASYQELAEQFLERSESIRMKYQEHKAELTAMVNVWSSINTDALLQETLCSGSNGKNTFSVKDYPDYAVAAEKISSREELKEWFDGMDKRIDGLLSVYETMLRTLVQQAEAITKEVEK